MRACQHKEIHASCVYIIMISHNIKDAYIYTPLCVKSNFVVCS